MASASPLLGWHPRRSMGSFTTRPQPPSRHRPGTAAPVCYVASHHVALLHQDQNTRDISRSRAGSRKYRQQCLGLLIPVPPFRRRPKAAGALGIHFSGIATQIREWRLQSTRCGTGRRPRPVLRPGCPRLTFAWAGSCSRLPGFLAAKHSNSLFGDDRMSLRVIPGFGIVPMSRRSPPMKGAPMVARIEYADFPVPAR